ncbi:right-handed parallel beta-helix repeat-containing protein [Candidatus Poribacteria bacterium]|nr:right-handed parallel beta-helix repeat-containing protein [Candidatus Poribacteria bacterium]
MKKLSISVFVVSIFVCQLLDAATIRVPQNQPTIQAGIDAAVNGDTVLVDDGTYTGAGNVNLDFRGKGIRLKSANGAVATIIDCQFVEGTRGVIFQSEETAAAVLDGFTIKNSKFTGGSTTNGYGGGILCNSASPTITNNIITGNLATWGSGIGCIFSASPTITNNTISGNSAIKTGGGIDCSTSASPLIINNIITRNSADFGGGGIRCAFSSAPVMTNNIILGNSAIDTIGPFGKGGGIFLFESSPTINHCTITGNTANLGGAILSEASSPTIKNTILWGDTATKEGNEIYLFNSRDLMQLTFSDVQGGQAGFSGNPTAITASVYRNNISADPRFVDAANGDYHLQDSSPCIGKGDTFDPPTTDIE